MHSDEWRKNGCRFGDRIAISGPVYYRHVYSVSGELVGVVVDYELADDFHYELLAADWKRFRDEHLGGAEESEAFRAFIEEHGLDTFAGRFAFENALKEADIVFQKIAFY